MSQHPNRKPDGPLSVAERNTVVEAFLREYPEPLALPLAKWPAFTAAAIRREGWEEVEGECLLAVVNAARLYDPAHGEAFTALAVQHLRAAVKEVLRRHTRDRRRLGGAEVCPLDAPAGDGRTAAELVSDRPTVGVDAELVAHLLGKIAPDLREHLERWAGLVGEPADCVAMAERDGVNYATVRTRHRRAVRECRRLLELDTVTL